MMCYIASALIFLLLCTSGFDNAHADIVRIGGLFHTRSVQQVSVFKGAIDDINSNGYLSYHELDGLLEYVPEMDSFQVGKIVCQLLKNGVAAIVGPESPTTAVHVQSICDTKEIPHIETRWDSLQNRGGCSVNLHPHPAYLADALFAVVEKYHWECFTILYEKELSLAAMSKLLSLADNQGYFIMIRQLEKGDNYRQVLRDIQKSACNNVVLECSLDILPEVLKQAQQVGIMVADYNYVITNLDLQSLDLEFLYYGGTNITGFTMIPPEEVPPSHVQDGPMLLSSALLYDAVTLFTTALSSIHEVNITEMKSLDCAAEESWAHGYTLINFMKATEIRGLTGIIKFDNQGFRTDFELGLVELTEEGLVSVGKWNTSQGLNLTRHNEEVGLQNATETMANKSFIVLIAMSDPYGMLREASTPLTGNDRYEGFGIDLIKELALMLGFNYTFQLQVDNAYGSLDKKTGQWNGMLREIMDGRADLAITDLTITHDRESVVDFTMPFMNLGISILYKTPRKEPPKLFSFLSPFSNEVWMYVLGAYLGVSILLFVMARISPYEWTNPYPCIDDPDVLENQFSLKNSLWFTIGSLMQQGSEIAPIAVSTRMVAGIWWFFTLIMVSSYTANLAAFLTVESNFSPFTNVRELANNDKGIMYGAKKGGSTLSFFSDSTMEEYKKMALYMDENPEVLTTTNSEGLDWVQNKNYAYLMESSSIEYIIERNCNVTQIGGLLDSKGYGIAMKKNSPYRNELSTAVLQLQETGQLSNLKRKWWKEKRGGGACEEDDSSTEASELDLKNVGGVFVVLVAGVFMACFITIFEMLWNIHNVTRKEKVSFKEELVEELRFIIKCHGSTKPVRKYEHDEDEEDDNRHQPSITNFGGWFENNEKKTPLP